MPLISLNNDQRNGGREGGSEERRKDLQRYPGFSKIKKKKKEEEFVEITREAQLTTYNGIHDEVLFM